MGRWKILIGVLIVVAVGGYWFFMSRDAVHIAGDGSGNDPCSGYAAVDMESRSDMPRGRGEEHDRSIGGVRSPVELELTLLDTNELEGDDSGGDALVELFLKPLIDSPDMRWFLKVPEGLSLVSGPSSWEGRMEKGEEKTFLLTFSVPDGRRYELYGRAEVFLENGDVITKGAGLRIDLGPKDPGPNPSFERVDKDGKRIISYKGRVEEGSR